MLRTPKILVILLISRWKIILRKETEPNKYQAQVVSVRPVGCFNFEVVGVRNSNVSAVFFSHQFCAEVPPRFWNNAGSFQTFP